MQKKEQFNGNKSERNEKKPLQLRVYKNLNK
jgi:hypothetical protein